MKERIEIFPGSNLNKIIEFCSGNQVTISLILERLCAKMTLDEFCTILDELGYKK